MMIDDDDLIMHLIAAAGYLEGTCHHLKCSAGYLKASESKLFRCLTEPGLAYSGKLLFLALGLVFGDNIFAWFSGFCRKEKAGEKIFDRCKPFVY